MAPEKKEKNPRAWDALTPPLADWILEFLSSNGYTKPTPVQMATLPLFMKNSDVVVEAVTGSGKTLAFVLPVVDKVLRSEAKKHSVTGIILTPTRELATQIHNVLLALLAFHPPSAEILPHLKGDEKRPTTPDAVIVPQLVVGGTVKVQADLSFFIRHSPNLLIGTPGRLAELISSSHVKTSSLEVLVLDEADRLLDLGFRADIGRILGYLPKQRRTGLFSASMSEAIQELIRVGLRNPTRIAVTVKSLKDGGVIEERKTPASLQRSYMVVPASHKLPALMQLLEKASPRPQKVIVFLSTCFAVKYFQRVLPTLMTSGFTLVPLHGKMEPAVRSRSFEKFVNSVTPTVLLTTDVASRGLDIPQVDQVIEVDPPADPATHLHRAGRSGRNGRIGRAVIMLHPGREEEFVEYMAVRKTPIAELTNPEISVSADDAEAFTARIRQQATDDREIFEMGVRGFVAFVRSYIEHRAKSIFRVNELDWVDMANGWGLLEIPKMPETKGLDIDRTMGLGIDVAAITFKDKAKEKRRQAEIAERLARVDEDAAEEGRRRQKRKNNKAWSEKHERQEMKVARREKKQRRRDAEQHSKMTDQEKDEKKMLDDLISEIRRKNQDEAATADDEFEGFGD